MSITCISLKSSRCLRQKIKEIIKLWVFLVNQLQLSKQKQLLKEQPQTKPQQQLQHQQITLQH